MGAVHHIRSSRFELRCLVEFWIFHNRKKGEKPADLPKTGVWRKLRLLPHWLGSYPGLIWRYLRAPAPDAVIVGYMGHLDVLVLWPLARSRRDPMSASNGRLI